MAGRLTQTTIPKLHPGRYTDAGSGLVLHVLDTARNGRSRTWKVRFVIKGTQRRREMVLGKYPVISLSEARQLADETRRIARDGQDPIDKRDKRRRENITAAQTCVTFREAAETHIKVHQASWRNAKHRQQWTNTLATYAYPVMGKMDVAEITIHTVLAVLEPIWTTKPETASRLRGRIEAVLDGAIARGQRDHPNPAVWRGNLKAVLPAPSRIHHPVNHPYLPYELLPQFMDKLSTRQGNAARALELLIYTASRSGEIIKARWVEINLEKKIWTIPASRMKAGKEHRIPLSTKSLSVLAKVKVFRKLSPFVFPSANYDKALSGAAFQALLKRMEHQHITPHGFRATFKTWASEETHHAREIIEGSLAHRLGDAAEQAYSRGDYLEKRRLLIEDWAQFCCSKIENE